MRKNIPYKLGAWQRTTLLGLGSLLAISVSTSLAPPAFSATEQPEKIAFEYQLENRNDPFFPFVKEETVASPINADEIVESEEELFGMQLFEPDQLKVVAVLNTSGKKVAMVQDQIGQGYPISIGTLIGKRGVVKEISPKGVVIEETAVTRSGKKKLTSIVMALKPEGE